MLKRIIVQLNIRMKLFLRLVKNYNEGSDLEKSRTICCNKFYRKKYQFYEY